MTRHWYSILAALAAEAWLANSSPTKRAAVTSCLSEANVPFVTRDSSLWTQNLAHFNSRLNYEPIVVAVPATTAQVADAVKCGEKNYLAVTAKSGGHSFTSLGLGGEDGHLVIQLDGMYNVELNKDNNTAKIQPGARLGHVDMELYKQGKRALSHGYCPGVGIGGHAAHGGYGMVSRKYGLTLDAVTGATVVLYDGTIVHSSQTERPDLFWALRGAGSSFGIITEFEVNTFPAPKEVTNFGFRLDWDQDTAPEGLLAVQRFVETMPSEISAQIDVRVTGYSFNGSYVGDEASLRRVLRPLLNKFDVQLVATSGSWIEYAEFWDSGLSALQPDIDITSPTYNESLPIYTTGAVTPGLSIKQFKSLSKYIATKIQQSGPAWSIQIFLWGGQSSAITKPKNTDTAYAHRDQLLIFQYTDVVLDQRVHPAGFSLGEGFVKIITEGFADGEWGMYPNVPDSQLSNSEAEKLYWGGNLPRLRVLKTEYDPKNVFRNPQSVQPLN